MPSTDGRKQRADGELSRARIHRYIADYTAAHAIAPTLAEIAAEVSLKVPTVHYHLKRLRDRGIITIDHGSRAVTLLVWPGGDE